MTQIELLTAFKKSLVAFVDDLNNLLPYDQNIQKLKSAIGFGFPTETVLNTFAARVLPHADLIKTKDDKYFLECNDLFAGLNPENVDYFKDIWKSSVLSKNDKEQFWRWMKLFLLYAQRFSQISS